MATKTTQMVYRDYLKPVIDRVLALVLIIITFPISIIIAIAIRYESHGPALFRQERTGLHGKTFTMYKFRSMAIHNDVNDSSSADAHTRCGKFLRKTSLDEIPQMINVLKGEMSFVGPRPWIPQYYKYMTDRQRHRNDVRPGITGGQWNRRDNNIIIPRH